MMTIDDANGTPNRFSDTPGKRWWENWLHFSSQNRRPSTPVFADAMADERDGGIGIRMHDEEAGRRGLPAQVLIRPISRGDRKPEKAFMWTIHRSREVEDALRRREYHYRTLAEAARISSVQPR
jgi:hypothetical protein